jgi:hypothetical protein
MIANPGCLLGFYQQLRVGNVCLGSPFALQIDEFSLQLPNLLNVACFCKT